MNFARKGEKEGGKSGKKTSVIIAEFRRDLFAVGRFVKSGCNSLKSGKTFLGLDPTNERWHYF